MTLPEPPPRQLTLRIDKEALADNWRTLNRLSGDAEAGAAVKAEGYGLGTDPVMRALTSAGARHFFVAHWSEVAGVLAHVPGDQIAVLHGVSTAEEARYARETGAVPVLNSIFQAEIWQQSGGGRCHLMLDSGMNRLGLEPGQIGASAIAALDVDILMSHLASADEDTPQNAQQLGVFRSAIAQLPACRHSLANSAGIVLGPDFHFDLTRPGLSLYGGIARPELAAALRQVVYIEARVLQLRELSPGDKVGYNALWTAQRPTRAATIALGYADGFLRSWSQNAALHHEGTELPLIGRVSMDMVIADASDAPDLAVGDTVQIPYDLPAASAASGLSQYELLTVLGQRFTRID